MTTLALLYDSSCRCSAATAQALAQYIDWCPVQLCNLLTCTAEDIQAHSTLLMALPIHAFGTPDHPWADAWPTLSEVSYQGKYVVLCGTGSDFCFDDDRLQALAALSDQLNSLGACMIQGMSDIPMNLINHWMEQSACRWQQQPRLIFSDQRGTRQQPLHHAELNDLCQRIRQHQQFGIS